MQKRQTRKGQSVTKKSQPALPVIVDQLLAVSEAASRLGIGKTRLYELINANQFPSVEISGAGDKVKRISALTLNAWIKDREAVKHAS